MYHCTLPIFPLSYLIYLLCLFSCVHSLISCTFLPFLFFFLVCLRYISLFYFFFLISFTSCWLTSFFLSKFLFWFFSFIFLLSFLPSFLYFYISIFLFFSLILSRLFLHTLCLLPCPRLLSLCPCLPVYLLPSSFFSSSLYPFHAFLLLPLVFSFLSYQFSDTYYLSSLIEALSRTVTPGVSIVTTGR